MTLPIGMSAKDLDTYFQTVEAQFADITPGCAKRVEWHGGVGDVTDWAVLYVHGFSATSEEIRPVTDNVATALRANIVYTRLQGHGRTGEALGDAKLDAWRSDFSEALSAAKLVGRKILIMCTSTGGTLTAEATVNETEMERVAGVVFVAPNFGVNNPAAPMLTWTGARIWLPWIVGKELQFDAESVAHETYWTTRYPTKALFPMAHLVRQVKSLDFRQAKMPALFWYYDDDEIVRAADTAKVAAAWGGPTQIIKPELGPQDAPNKHNIIGDIVSPNQTAHATKEIVAWTQGL